MLIQIQRKHVWVPYYTFKGIPPNGSWCIDDTVESYQKYQMAPDRFDRRRKYLGNNILQIYCSFEKKMYIKTVTEKSVWVVLNF